ncbi:MAG: D-Ala-D-Ala transporter [Euryarchaeota archaeon]|jgi:ABC-type dipeptide/oligopeptide/nickel transport system permease component|nr:D-Ala-D-Ala transporter [Euryarchaeota archaeon]|tara:strand:- start:1008 stop:2012 length:1005 start_codon:yes stop_codon:yes gene_type:complete
MRILVLIINRLAWFIPTLIGLMIITFTISHIIPADPVAFFAGENATAEQIAELRARYGFDKPLPVQLFNYFIGVCQGDLGISLYTQRPISEDLLSRLPATMELTIMAVIFSSVVGVPLGVIAAVYRNSMLDHVLRVITVSGLAIASFWLAILFQLLFAMELQLTPLQGRIDGWGPDPVTGFFIIDSLLTGDMESLGSTASHLVLPTLTLAFPAMATIVRFTRAGVLDAINSNYVLYEQAMGFPGRVIIWKYVLRNALIGTVTQIGLIFGILIAGAVVVEAVFDWPGLGLYAVQSILNSDYNAIMGFTLVTGAFFILINLAVDIMHGIIDPRTQE